MVRGEMGLKNVEMIHFVRTLDMAKDVNEVLVSRRTSWLQGLKTDGKCCGGHKKPRLRRSFNFIQMLHMNAYD